MSNTKKTSPEVHRRSRLDRPEGSGKRGPIKGTPVVALGGRPVEPRDAVGYRREIDRIARLRTALLAGEDLTSTSPIVVACDRLLDLLKPYASPVRAVP